MVPGFRGNENEMLADVSPASSSSLAMSALRREGSGQPGADAL